MTRDEQARYPHVFPQPALVSCGRGWYELIEWVCKQLEAIIQRLPPSDREHYRMMEIQEKYGTLDLRFRYPRHENHPGYNPEAKETIRHLLKAAERRSLYICEVCGKPGELRLYSWCKTHCDECFTPEDLCPEAWDGVIRIF